MNGAAVFISLGICLICVIAWAVAFVLFHITVVWMRCLLVLAVVFLIPHRIFEARKQVDLA